MFRRKPVKSPARRTRRRRLRSETLERRHLLAVVFGDFDGNGFDDMAAGSPGESIGSIEGAGAVNVIYSGGSGLAANPSGGRPDQIWHQNHAGVIGAAEAGDGFGSVLAAGDFDGDGYDDLAIGVTGESIGAVQQAGAVQILYGSSNGLTSAGDHMFHQDTPLMDDTAEAFDHFGQALTAGNFNGDVNPFTGLPIDDLAIGVPGEDVDGLHNAGQVQLLYGRAFTGLSVENQGTINQDSDNDFDSPAESYDRFGSVLAAGDFNADGNSDLAIGVPGEDISGLIDAGATNVVFGSSSGLNLNSASIWHQNSSGVPNTVEAFDTYGATLAVGDFDNDGADDLAIGVTGEDVEVDGFEIVNAGAVNVMHGISGSFSFNSHQFWSLESVGVNLSASIYDHFGTALTAGDFNGDSRFDLAIGTPLKAVGENDAGVINVLYGTGTGLQSANDRSYSQDTPGVAETTSYQNYFGAHLAAGDADGNGRWDLGVAVPGENSDRGAVHMFYGRSAYGFRTDNDQVWSQGSASINGAHEIGDSFGGPLVGYMVNEVPALSSDPAAPVHLFLDFDGGFSPNNDLDLSTNIYTNEFDIDGDYFSFGPGEQALILDAWAHVADDFAPWEINVTTVDPGNNNGDVYRVLIGDDGVERKDGPTSGWSGGNDVYLTSADNDVFVFSESGAFTLSGNYGAQLGTTAAHEAGHGFGLNHKNDYALAVGGGYVETNDYTNADEFYTPIMGSNLQTDRTIWTQSFVDTGAGTAILGSPDVEILSETLDLRPDDHPHGFFAHTDLGGLNGTLMTSGLIEQRLDLDIFEFDVSDPSVVDLDLRGADIGGNLDATLQLFRYDNGLEEIAYDAPADSGNAAMQEFLLPGTYYAFVGSQADYTGDIGQYTLRIEQAPFQSNPVINGTSASDEIIVEFPPYDPNALQVVLNGEVVFFQEGGIDTLTINGLAGFDVIRVRDTYGNMDLVIDGGVDYDVIDIGDGNLNNVRAEITVIDTSIGEDAVVIDSSETPATTYGFVGSTFDTDGNFGSLEFGSPSHVRDVILHAGDNANHVSVTSSPTNALHSNLYLYGHGGSDTFEIGAGPNNAAVDGLGFIDGDIWINGGGGFGDVIRVNDHHGTAETYTFDGNVLSLSNTELTFLGTETLRLYGTSGDDEMNVNSISGVNFLRLYGRGGEDDIHLGSHINGDLTDIEASVTAYGGSLSADPGDSIHFHDQVGDAGDYRINATTFVNDATDQTFFFHLFDHLSLDATSHDDIVTVSSVSPIDIDLNGRMGNDTFHIGADGGGNLALMRADLTIQGSFGNDSLVLNDRSANGNASSTIGSISFDSTRTWFGSLAFYSIDDVTFHGSEYADTVELLSTGWLFPFDFTMRGYGGNDALTLGNNGNVDSISGEVWFYGYSGIDAITVDDSQADQSHQYAIGFSSIDRDGELLARYFSTEHVVILGGLLDDEINVNGLLGFTDLRIIGGLGETLLDVAPQWQDFDSTILGNIIVQGNAIINIHDRDDTGDDAYTLGVSEFQKNGVGATVAYDAGSVVTLYGNHHHNQINVNSSAASGASSFVVFAGAGDDTATGGAGDDTLFGEDGNDLLRGNGGNDILVGGGGNDGLLGGSGRDLLIGGRNADNLRGGAGQDIVIGDTTIYDHDANSLKSIIREWGSNRNFNARVENISGQQNPEFAERLNGKTFLRRGKSVVNDAAVDQVFGQADLDWLFVSKGDSDDHTPAEIVG